MHHVTGPLSFGAVKAFSTMDRGRSLETLIHAVIKWLLHILMAPVIPAPLTCRPYDILFDPFYFHHGYQGSRTASEGRPAPQRKGNLMNGLIDGYGVGGGRRGILAVTNEKYEKLFFFIGLNISRGKKRVFITADMRKHACSTNCNHVRC